MAGPLRGLAFLLVLLATGWSRGLAQAPGAPSYLRDRGDAVSSSLFGTYLQKGELLVFPFLAYTRDHNREYQPVALGYGLDEDFRSRYRDQSAQLFVGYGLTNWLAVELEASYLSARFDKSPSDPSSVPARITESGFADLEGQLRARVLRETPGRPELIAWLELTPASQRHKVLIGEPDWDLKPGIGFIKGFSFGTLMARIAAEWNREARSPDFGEATIEYLKRVSPALRINLALEGGETGAMDEWEVIGGFRLRMARGLYLKVDNGIGISSKATDWSPQLGLMFSSRIH